MSLKSFVATSALVAAMGFAPAAMAQNTIGTITVSDEEWPSVVAHCQALLAEQQAGTTGGSDTGNGDDTENGDDAENGDADNPDNPEATDDTDNGSDVEASLAEDVATPSIQLDSITVSECEAAGITVDGETSVQ